MKARILQLKDILNRSRTSGSFIHSLKHNTSFYIANFVLQFLFTPFITRIYTPEAYGTFSLLNSIAMYLTIVFTFQLEPTIMLQKEEKEVQNTAAKIYTISLYWFIFSTVLFFLYYLAGGLLQLDDRYRMPSFILLAPVAAFILVLNNIFGNLSNRLKRYKEVFRIATPAFLGSKLLTIVYGLFVRNNFTGLFFGEYILKLITIFIGFPYILALRVRDNFRVVSFHKLVAFCREKRHYLYFEMPSRFISMFASQMPVLFLALYFGRNSLGQYALAASMLEIPIRLFSYSIGGVFYQKASEIIFDNQPLMNRSRKLLLSLAFLGIIPFTLLAIFSVDLFTFFFGAKWVLAGQMSTVLCLLFYSRFVSESFQMLFRALNKLRQYFILIALMGLLQLVYFFVCVNVTQQILIVMLGYSILAFTVNAFITLIVFRAVREHDKKLYTNSYAPSGN